MLINILLLSVIFCVIILSIATRKKTIVKEPSKADNIRVINVALDKSNLEMCKNSEETSLKNQQEERILDRSNTLTVRVTACAYLDFIQSDYYYNLHKLYNNLIDLQNELIILSKSKRYPLYVKKAKKGMKIDGYLMSSKLSSFLSNPNVSMTPILKRKQEEILSNYKIYWENAISGLRQDAAIIKRRKYLIDDIDKLLPIISKNNPEFIDEFINYRTYNIEQITKNNHEKDIVNSMCGSN